MYRSRDLYITCSQQLKNADLFQVHNKNYMWKHRGNLIKFKNAHQCLTSKQNAEKLKIKNNQ